MAKKKFITENFLGVVYLKEWFYSHKPGGKGYLAVMGYLTILKDTNAVGFEVSTKESNWCVRASSEDGSASINILGCQIRCVSNLSELPKEIAENCLSVVAGV